MLLFSLIAWPMMTLAAPTQNLSVPRKITVAVIDTGADLQHPALKNRFWINPGEHGVDALGRDKQDNGIDDDGNGFVDDVHGWNFAARNNDLKDSHGHGTHIAGIIAAQPTTSNTFHGVSDQAELMILKYYDPKAFGENNLLSSVEAIYYAVKMGAEIINYSGGGGERSLDEEKALRWAQSRGILVIAAAGNEKSNSDIKKYYPAGYGLTNIMSVTAHDDNKNILPSSNYGVYSVDIAAPGKSIESTLPGKGYGKMTGTSQATAFVTGAAVTLLSQSPRKLAPEKVIQTLVAAGTKEFSLKGKTKFQVALNTENLNQVLADRASTELAEVSRSQRAPAQNAAELFSFKSSGKNKSTRLSLKN